MFSRWISADDISYLDPESIGGLNLFAYCGNNPVMYTDGTGTSPSSFWKGVIANGAAVIIVGGIALITVATGGLAAPVLIGAGIGALSGGIISTGMQLLTTGTIDVGQLLLDVAVGGVMGAFGGSNIGRIGMTIAGTAVGFGSSVALDVIVGTDINWGKAAFSGLLGGAFAFAGGAGAQNGKTQRLNQLKDSLTKINKTQPNGGYARNLDKDIKKAAEKLYNLSLDAIYYGIYPSFITNIIDFAF